VVKAATGREGVVGMLGAASSSVMGTRRSRVNVFMNKFRTLGFVDDNKDGVTVHPALLGVVLHDFPASDH
jgi:hypothetical protein